jgi:hypothetical protein
MAILIYGVAFKDVYEVEISLGSEGRRETKEIPAQSADEARSIGRGYNGHENVVYSVKGRFFDWPGMDQLPSLRRAAMTTIEHKEG